MAHNDDKTEILGDGDPRRQPRLGRYRLERRIGQGGMAEIFLARADGPAGFEKQVVIKRIRPQLSRNVRFVEMFLREAKLLATLNHPNVVRIFELDVQDGEYFLALEYLEGLSLREVIERTWHHKRPLPIEPLIQIFGDAALGLEHAHNAREPSGRPAGLVHRDVSPDNIFVTTAGVSKMIDFGIAKQQNADSLTQAGELKGKIPYMSPEQLKGEAIDARTDIFSLGVSMYWALAGKRPFDGVADVHTMKGILEDPPPPLRGLNPRVPASLEQVVMACLEKDRHRRIKSAHALHDALMTLLVGLPRVWPTPATVVEQAMALRAVAHEVAPGGLPAVPIAVWPDRHPDDDRTALGRKKGTESGKADISTRRAIPLPPRTEDSVPRLRDEGAPDPVASTHKIPVWAPEPAAEEPLGPPTDETERPRSSGDGSFLVNSDPVLDLSRVAVDERVKIEKRPPRPGNAPSVSPMAKTRLSGGALTAPARNATEEQAPVQDDDADHIDDDSADAGVPVVPQAPRPRGATAIVAGVMTALAVVFGVAWFSGALQHLRGEAADAGPAGVWSDGGMVVGGPVLPADAGSAAVDAGAADAGVVLAAVDAGAAVDGGTATKQRPRLQLIGPDSVQWQGLDGEVIARGRTLVELPPGTRALFAVDLITSGKTRVAIDKGTKVIDYNKLPRGKIALRAKPFADVFLGEEKVGRTPLADRSVVAGLYQVRFVYKKKTKVMEVEVKPRQRALAQHDFR